MSFKDSIRKIGINEADVVDWRDAKLYQTSGDDNMGYPGYIVLANGQLVFVSKKGLLRGIKKMYEIEASNIQSISKLPLTSQFTIVANTAEKGSGFFKRMLKSKNAQLSIKDGKSFVEKVRTINPAIK